MNLKRVFFIASVLILVFSPKISIAQYLAGEKLDSAFIKKRSEIFTHFVLVNGRDFGRTEKATYYLGDNKQYRVTHTGDTLFLSLSRFHIDQVVYVYSYNGAVFVPKYWDKRVSAKDEKELLFLMRGVGPAE